MWSLSIEEQFYLIWPIIMFAALSVARSEIVLRRVTAVLIVGLWGLRILLAMNHAIPADRLYNGTDTRISSILRGCLAALLLRNNTLGVKLRQMAGGMAIVSGLAVAAIIGSMAALIGATGQCFIGVSAFFQAASVRSRADE